MKSFFTAAALAAGASAAALNIPRATTGQCCFGLNVNGGYQSGSLGQLSDGQNRVGPGFGGANYCLASGTITDENGYACVIAMPQTQFQCDLNGTPTPGFTTTSAGLLAYNGNTTFYECAATSDSQFNIYTTPYESYCAAITLSTTGNTCSAVSSASAQVSTVTASVVSTMPASTATMPASTVTMSVTGTAQTVTQVQTVSGVASTVTVTGAAQTVVNTQTVTGVPSTVTVSVTGASNTVDLTQTLLNTQTLVNTQTVAGAASTITVTAACSAVTNYITQTVSQTIVQTQTAPGTTIYVTATAPGTTVVEATTQTASTTLIEATTQTAPTTVVEVTTQTATVIEVTTQITPTTVVEATTQTASTTLVEATTQTATVTQATTQTQVTTQTPVTTVASSTPVTTVSTTASVCSPDLSGAYQTPLLIVPVNSESPDTAYGTQYFGYVNSDNSTIFNFDIPSSYAGETCSLIFLLPLASELETSSYTLSGTGTVEVLELSSPATSSTTYNNQPSVEVDLGSFSLTAGTSTVIATTACAAGESVTYELKASGDYSLEFFEDWNPSPLGLFIRAC